MNLNTALNLNASFQGAAEKEVPDGAIRGSADVNTRWHGGRTLLMQTAWDGNTASTASLLARGAAVGIKDPEGWTALHCAAWNGCTAAARLLLEAGAAVDDRDGEGWTPLVRAAGNNRADTVELLLAYGADPDAATRDGRTARKRAEKNGCADTLKVLDAPPPARILPGTSTSSNGIKWPRGLNL